MSSSVALPGDETDEANVAKQLRVIYAKDAAEYEIFRDPDMREKLQLREEPIYVWTNAVRRQNGSVFIWTWNGRPEAIGSIFTYPAQVSGKLGVMHEFHSLSTSVLIIKRPGKEDMPWKPKAGLSRTSLPNAPEPAASPRQRLFQMRELAREFTADSVDTEGQAWELRLLPQPLDRYESTDPNIIDGALFSFVTSAGTDPEILLLLEAHKTDSGVDWRYAAARFSSSNMQLKLRAKEVWSSIIDEENTRQHDPLFLYSLFRDRRIDVITPE